MITRDSAQVSGLVPVLTRVQLSASRILHMMKESVLHIMYDDTK
jgi:hypothetical protein